jgi:hypothetical protein
VVITPGMLPVMLCCRQNLKEVADFFYLLSFLLFFRCFFALFSFLVAFYLRSSKQTSCPPPSAFTLTGAVNTAA